MLTNKAKPKQRWLDLAPGDTVVVIAGKDKGKQGEVLRTLPSAGKIVVRGVNVSKRHAKAGQSAGGTKAIQGGIIDFESPLSYSNVMLVCPQCHEPTRVKHTVLDNGARAIACRNCGEPYERIKRTEVQ